ncbi:MAG: efflux RND transporter periplasmic adaptor subunit [bacterium]|nr:efflux RND transporter periplasmic adaptor subunit [bacterium]
MNRKFRNLAVLVFVVAALIAVFGVRFLQLGQSTALASIRSEQERLGIPVETVAATRGELADWITLAGTVEGVTQYPVVSGNALRVVGIPVVEGMAVTKGDVILRLANEAPNPMFHSVSRSIATHENALRDARRMRNLYAEGAVSKQQLDAAETALRVAESDLQDAEGSTVLLAGESGVVAAILVKEGETVAVNKPLVWIADTHEVNVQFDAGSNQALSLAREQFAVWRTPTGAEVEGRLTELDLMADPDTHLLSGKVRFPNADGRLVPGLLVSFRVRIAYRADALTVPSAAVQAGETSPEVWLVRHADGEEQARLRPVATGLGTTDRVEIALGLEPGDLVVLHGQTLLTDGVKINDVTERGGE